MSVNVRPPRAPRPWASITNYSAPGQAWDTQPSKVRPADALIDAGWWPTERPPAERWNWKLNDVDRRQAAQDMMEARTFVEPGDGKGLCDAGVGSTVGDYAFATFNQIPEIYHASNSTVISVSKDGGYTWTASTTLAVSSVLSGIATRDDGSKQGAACASYTNSGVAKIVMSGAGGGVTTTWTSTTLTGTGTLNAANCVVADPNVGSIFFVGGNDQSGGVYSPKVWRVVDTFGAFASQTVLGMAGTFGAGPVYTVRLVAVSPTYKVASMYVSSTNSMWRWLDGDATGTAITPPTTDEIRDILWLPEDSLWMAISQSAGGSVKLWTSADASTGSWSQVGTTLAGVTKTPDGLSLWNSMAVYVGGACVRGSIIMLPVFANTTAPYLLISGDAGQSWEVLADPLARHQSATAIVQKARVLGPRFIAGGLQTGTKVAHALTMRAG